MDEEIRKHVAALNEADGFGVDDASIIETILAAEEVWCGNESKRRWWTDCFCVVKVGGMLIGFDGAITTGDESPSEKGWEFNPKSICKVAAKEITYTTYVPA